LSYAPFAWVQLRPWGTLRTSLRVMGDCSCCSREAALQNHRTGRMRIPIKNITQAVTMLPTLGRPGYSRRGLVEGLQERC